MTTWDKRFMAMAQLVAGWSKDPTSQVGAVIVRPDKTIASVGYNGFPRGVDDAPAVLHNREVKRMRTVHAELNAILNAHGRVSWCHLYVTMHPCSQCAAAIIQTDITRVITPAPDAKSSWLDTMREAAIMFDQAGVEVIHT